MRESRTSVNMGNGPHRDNGEAVAGSPSSLRFTHLEVMLVSPNVDARSLFSNLRVVIVDEIHAFAGDDRGGVGSG